MDSKGVEERWKERNRIWRVLNVSVRVFVGLEVEKLLELNYEIKIRGL